MRSESEPVLQLRPVVEAEDFDEALALRSLNSRLDAPAGLQVTLFQELESLEERKHGEGFGTAGRD